MLRRRFQHLWLHDHTYSILEAITHFLLFRSRHRIFLIALVTNVFRRLTFQDLDFSLGSRDAGRW